MDAVTSMLEGADISFELVEHAPVYTVADVAEHMPGIYPVKNLLLQEEKGERCIFVIMYGDDRLDTKKLQAHMDSRKLQFAKPNVLMEKLGVEPGSASLFSLLHDGSGDVEVVIDTRLTEQDRLGFHPSVNTATIFIHGKDISTFMDAIRRPYQLVDL